MSPPAPRIIATLFAGALGLVLAASGCSSPHPNAPNRPSSSASATASQLNDGASGGAFQGVGLTPPQPRPSFTLIDDSGKSFNFGEQTAGRPTLLYFGYTNCPDVCPQTMADIGLALRSLPVALQKQTDVVFVSTDVKHDTGPIIKTWLTNFSDGTQANFVGLRGTQAQVNAAQAAAHVPLAEDGGQTHSATVFLFGHDDYARVIYPQSNVEQQAIAHDLPIVAKS
ncbi:MAG: SCO family protein [Actinomycetota bacterium]|nr:SCO family protein [Actinomycetota bacterium]MDP9168284.1 SCO family protein [Actinomycetota bacterium]